MEFTIKRYDVQNQFPITVANQIVRIFVKNYPAMHDVLNRVEDITTRRNGASLQKLLDEGRIFFTIENNLNILIGFLEMRTVPQPADNRVCMQLIWIMIDSAYEGNGAASKLHDAYIEECQQQARLQLVPCFQFLTVHTRNPHPILIYEKWGYTEGGSIGVGKIYMFKKIEK